MEANDNNVVVVGEDIAPKNGLATLILPFEEVVSCLDAAVASRSNAADNLCPRVLFAFVAEVGGLTLGALVRSWRGLECGEGVNGEGARSR